MALFCSNNLIRQTYGYGAKCNKTYKHSHTTSNTLGFRGDPLKKGDKRAALLVQNIIKHISFDLLIFYLTAK